MSGFRAYCETSALVSASNGDVIILSLDESRHLCGSLRAKVGDSVDAFNLEGDVIECIIVDASPKRARLEVKGRKAPHKAAVDVVLAQCLPKGKAFDDIIRQSVEVGAAGIIPIISSRCEVRLDSSDALRKHEKWRAKVVEAVKQSANFSEFEIAEPVNFSEFLSKYSSKFDLKIVASLRSGAIPIMDILRRSDKSGKVCILIGPEGDMTPDEYEASESAGFIPAVLGVNVMKSETAALFALSAAKAFFFSKETD